MGKRASGLRLAWLFGCLSVGRLVAAPAVFWASDPVRPGETVLALGAELGTQPTVVVERLMDGVVSQPPAAAPAINVIGPSATVRQADGRSVKFTMPTGVPGVYAWRLQSPAGTVQGLLNRPAVWWALGDGGTHAVPGGSLRLYGKNLCAPGSEQGKATVLLRGPRTVRLTAEADCYAAKTTLPRDLPVGDYQLAVHSGAGGDAAWSEAVPLRVENPRPWPTTVYNVKDFGAEGSGTRDDTTAVQAALAAADQRGGGVVYFPRGRYQLSAPLDLPRFTVLRGERAEWVNLFWPDFATPPPVLLRGRNSFGLQELTLYCSNYRTFLAADTKGPDAGDVFLRRLRVRAVIYRGHLQPEEIDQRYRQGLGGFGGGYWLAALGGRNVEVSDCDLVSSGCTISLTNARGARLERNLFSLGRLGGCGVFEGDGVLMADNQFAGADLTSACGAGGLGYGNLSHVVLQRNKFTAHYGMNGEAITSDAPGGLYHGRLAGADATSVTLPDAHHGAGRRAVGAAVFVADGPGVGQWRRVTAAEGRKLTVDRPWQVSPSDASTVMVAWLQHHWLVLDNEFADVGIAVQFYGSSAEHIAARNRCARSAGFHNFGMNYHGVQPSWCVQWLDNEITEGNIYRADHDQIRLTGDSHLGAYGLIGNEWRLPITVATIMRRNRLLNNASIVLGSEVRGIKPAPLGRPDPLVTDVVVEHNTIENAEYGLIVHGTTRGVWAAGNRLRNVRLEQWDEAAAVAADAERRRRFETSREPLAVWDFRRAVVTPAGLVQTVPDATGHGFDAAAVAVRVATDAFKGQVGRFDGDGYLSVADPAMFNLQNVTFALWVKPDTVTGRHGLLSKRFMATGAPYMLSLWDSGLEFEGNDEDGKWSFIFRSPADIKPAEWVHLAAVCELGKGVTVYCRGKAVGRKDNPARHCANGEPLIIGREAWSGLPNQQDPPAYYKGQMGTVKLWARALSELEVWSESR